MFLTTFLRTACAPGRTLPPPCPTKSNGDFAMESFEIASDLLASPDEVWPHLLNMESINTELAPIRMSYPAALPLSAIDPRQIPLGQVLFQSWVMLYRVIPLDRHALCLTEITQGQGFHEESTTWLQKHWIHDRRLTPCGTGSRVTDRLSFEPRLPGLGPLMAPIVRSTFERRHHRLRQRFGSANPGAVPRCQDLPQVSAG